MRQQRVLESGGQVFTATLTPEVHWRSPTAAGRPGLSLLVDNNSLRYKVTVQNLSNITAAHIHLGQSGTEGPPVVTLFSGEPKNGSGTLASGIITRSDLMGPLRGKDISDLLKEINNNNAYVNVHTERYPQGEIRGQVMAANTPTTGPSEMSKTSNAGCPTCGR